MKVKSDHKENKELEEWKNKYLRALADYQNLERRVFDARLEDKKIASKEIIIKFLPVLDDLIKAQVQIKNEGLKLLIDKFELVLKSEHVEKKDCMNQKFNESLMECIGIVEGKNDDEVVDQLRPAYLINGEVLRAAQVIVSKVSAKGGSAIG